MADTDFSKLPQATAVPKRRMRFSPVWIIPILAAVVAIGVAVERIINEGPSVTIVFRSAEGIEAGKTFLKYKDVNIGQVTAVRLSEDYDKVVVTAKIAKSAAGLMVEDARFWVVRPRFALTGVSGLSTLLSGNYIGFEAGKSDKSQRTFTGLEIPPIVTGGLPGRQFLLNASDLGSLGTGSPIYFRRLPVGQVVAYDLASDGKAVELKVFINSPYDKYVHPGTRFWNASGVDVSLTANGLDVRTESMAALIAGGLAFDTPDYLPDTELAAPNTVFTLYSDRATAMKTPDTIKRQFVLHFGESVRGLSVGAPVTFFGLPIGEVTSVGLTFNPETLNLRPRVSIAIFPERLVSHLSSKDQAMGQAWEKSIEKRKALLTRLVQERGLRAQLKSGSLITGQLYVALRYFPTAPKVKVDWSVEEPELPTVESLLPDLEQKLPSIIAKLDKLPLEEIGENLKNDLATLDETLKEAKKVMANVDAELVPELKSTLEDARKMIASADRVMKGAETTLVGPNAPVQQQLRDTLQEVTQAVRSLRVLTDYLERHPEALIRGKTDQKGRN